MKKQHKEQSKKEKRANEHAYRILVALWYGVDLSDVDLSHRDLSWVREHIRHALGQGIFITLRRKIAKKVSFN